MRGRGGRRCLLVNGFRSWQLAGFPEAGLSVTAALRIAQNASGWNWRSVCRSLAVVPCAARLLVRTVTEDARGSVAARRIDGVRIGRRALTPTLSRSTGRGRWGRGRREEFGCEFGRVGLIRWGR